LDEISLVASQVNRLDQPGTVNRITREGIEHIQASNLADLFELLPGQLSGTPSLTSARQSLLRQVPTTSEAARANALGTGFFVDGIPLSNNANLQDDVAILNAATELFQNIHLRSDYGVTAKAPPLNMLYLTWNGCRVPLWSWTLT